MSDQIVDHIEETPSVISPVPGLRERIQSTMIDVLSIITLMFIFSIIFERMESVPDYFRIIAFIFVWGLFEPLCTTLGCTPGNFISKIRVRRHSNIHQKLNFFQALIRYVIKTLLGIISFFTIHANPEKRAIHDLACDSIVIYK